jgi:rhomboid family GlyGly-CTERM serine protease
MPPRPELNPAAPLMSGGVPATAAGGRDLLAWPLLCALLGAASVAVWLASGAAAHEPLPPAALLWHPTAWWHRPWTLWTAALVHLSGVHLAANLLALGAVAVLGRALDAGRPATLAMLVAWPLTTLTLLAWPQVGSYGGLSGLIHAQVLVLWSLLAIKKIASPLAMALLLGTAFKLLMEHAWTQPQAFDPNWGFNVVYAAHLGGALVGAGCGVVGHAAAGSRGLTPAG